MWKGFFLAAFGFACVSAFGIIGGFSYFSSQAQKTPDWFTKSDSDSVLSTDKITGTTNTSNTSQPTPSANQVWQKIHNVPYHPSRSTTDGGRWKQVDLNAQELNSVLFTSLNSPSNPSSPSPNPSNHQPNNLVKDSHIRIADGKIMIGMIVDMQQLTEQLGDGQRAKTFQTMSTLLGGNSNKVYVELEGKPVVAPNRKLGLEENSRIKFANFNFTIDEFAQRTGISEDFIRDRLGIVSQKNPNVRGRNIGPISIYAVDVVGDKLRLGGTGTAW
jgi:hypothetical protein